jgi:Zn finger protein HypA/HybF involved in hydrogenase expression
MSNERIEISDVFRRFIGDYHKQYGDFKLASHRRAVSDILGCMTEAMGGKRYQCEDCSDTYWQYHGCRNRSCPKCHGQQILKWIEKRSVELLPCSCFHVVTTLPSELRRMFFAEQKYLYGLLMKSSAVALCEVSREKRFVGATPAIMALLHTWTGQLLYHPHVHMLVSGGGVSDDGKSWSEVSTNFLVPPKKLSPLISKRFAETMRRERPDLFALVPPKVWKREWCSFFKYVGEGRETVMRYLSRYVYRVAITRSRIAAVDNSHVTFTYKHQDTGEWKTARITGVEFIRRFLLHVLPRGFHKVRYYGLWHSSKRKLMNRARVMLQLSQKLEPATAPETMADLAAEALREGQPDSQTHAPKCPKCGSLNVRLIEDRRKGAAHRRI